MKREDEGPFRKTLLEKLLTYRNKNIYSAAAVSLYYVDPGKNGQNRLTTEYNDINKELQNDRETIFDLASLTKPLVTLLCILHLFDKGKLNWRDTVGEVFDIRVHKTLSRVSMEMLIGHSSGLPAHRDYAQSLFDIDAQKRKQWLLENLFQETIEERLPDTVLYSDLGYLLLGFVVETITGQPLDTFWSTTIARPVGVEKGLYYPNKDNSTGKMYAPTGRCRFTDQQLAGVVHDDNCRLLGGVCGHAGLFGTSAAVLRLAEEMLALYRGENTSLPIDPKTFRRACERVGCSDWSKGFQLVSAGNSSSGSYFSSDSFGHLGFTGTSFWIDPVQQLVVVVLTNRVIKGDDREAIRKMRPELHDGIIDYLVEKMNWKKSEPEEDRTNRQEADSSHG